LKTPEGWIAQFRVGRDSTTLYIPDTEHVWLEEEEPPEMTDEEVTKAFSHFIKKEEGKQADEEKIDSPESGSVDEDSSEDNPGSGTVEEIEEVISDEELEEVSDEELEEEVESFEKKSKTVIQ